MENTFTLKFVRNEGSSGITTMAHACCNLRPGLLDIAEASVNSADFVSGKLICAITTWMINSEEGYEALAATNNDFLPIHKTFRAPSQRPKPSDIPLNTDISSPRR